MKKFKSFKVSLDESRGKFTRNFDNVDVEIYTHTTEAKYDRKEYYIMVVKEAGVKDSVLGSFLFYHWDDGYHEDITDAEFVPDQNKKKGKLLKTVKGIRKIDFSDSGVYKQRDQEYFVDSNSSLKVFVDRRDNYYPTVHINL